MMRNHLSKLIFDNVKRSFASRHFTISSHYSKEVDVSSSQHGKSSIKGEIQHSLYPHLQMPETDLFTFAYNSCKAWQNKTFTQCAVTGKSYTYAQTLDSALRWGSAVETLLPNRKNATIAFICSNSPDFVPLILGSIAAGAVVSPINPLYTPEEAANQLKDSEAELLVVDSLYESNVDAILKLLGKSLPVVVNGVSQQGRPNAQEILMDKNAKMLNIDNMDPHQAAFLPYSSGTTGKPKGVRVSHHALALNTVMVSSDHFHKCKMAFDDHQEIQVGILPFFHVFGVTVTMLPGLYFGIKTITMPRFDPGVLISTFKENKVSFFQAVPLLFKFIASIDLITEEDLKSIHSLVSGGYPLSSEIFNALKRKAPHVIFQEGYGMTETLSTIGVPYTKENLGYCGQLLQDVKAKVVDVETREILPPNTPGELIIHTPARMLGYQNNVEATNEIMDEEGWIKTGDIAIYTEDGFYSITDRVKELIKVKGYQVSPTELEETLEKYPGIAEAGVIGIPHDTLGEVPVAFIVKDDDNVTERDIQSYMAKHVAEHKQLTGGVRFIDELPKNVTGKLLRKNLKTLV